MLLPSDSTERKNVPLYGGLVAYFPNALIAVAKVSVAGSQQHHPGEPLHWDRSKSADHADCLLRHLWGRGTIDTDGIRHSAKMVWRALALLETELEGRAP